MFFFLNGIWEESKDSFKDDFLDLLSGIAFVHDHWQSGDYAYWHEWQKYTSFRAHITEDDAYQAMMHTLEAYLKIGESETHEISNVIERLQNFPTETQIHWKQAIRQALSS